MQKHPTTLIANQIPIWVDPNLDSSQQGDSNCGGPSTMGELMKYQVHMMSKEFGNTSGDHEAMTSE